MVASGNGGHYKDNCNFDGYANSIFTVTIGWNLIVSFFQGFIQISFVFLIMRYIVWTCESLEIFLNDS